MPTTHPLTPETALRYVLDRFEIQDLVARYGLGQDLHQNDGNVSEEWNDVFAPDATVDYSVAGPPAGTSVPELVELMRGENGNMSALLAWQHFEGVATVTIDGDTAVARSPHLHTHKGDTEGNGWNLIEAGYFVDELQRRPEGWRIVHRVLEIVWMDTFATVAR
jgi:hypothetical protein